MEFFYDKHYIIERMNSNPALVIEQYLSTKQDVFTADTFYHDVKKQGVRLSKDDAVELLYSSNLVFPLMKNEFITRAGVFTGRCFSFVPSKEEVQKGYFFLGHRAMPFINPDCPPDKLFISDSKNIIPAEKCVFSMNLAMDTFALYGEGYVLPYIFGDHSNEKLALSSIQYSMPTEIQLTAWPLAAVSGKVPFMYGDRIFARVQNWQEGIIQVSVIRANRTNVVSSEDIEREEWYSEVEQALVTSIDKNGPAGSIEEQLAYLFLEHQQELCTHSCGSLEDFFKRTKAIGFSQYGVETRIWKQGEQIPFVGRWNQEISANSLYMQLQTMFSPQILDCFLQDYEYQKDKKTETKCLDDLIDDIFPFPGSLSPAEKKILVMQMEKRIQRFLKDNSFYSNKKLPKLRSRILALFTDVSKLMASVSISGLKLSDFPSQELIILEQLFSHVHKIVEEMGDMFLVNQLPIDDLLLSLEGMEDTFDDIQNTIKTSIDVNTYKNIKIIE